MNTKHIESTEERKKVKREARKKAAPKASRARIIDIPSILDVEQADRPGCVLY